jgi:hypothetical protein
VADALGDAAEEGEGVRVGSALPLPLLEAAAVAEAEALREARGEALPLPHCEGGALAGGVTVSEASRG